MVMWRRRTLKMNSLVASQVYTQRSVNMDTTKLFIFSVLLLLVITTVSTKSLDSQADSDEPRSCKKYGEACGLDLSGIAVRVCFVIPPGGALGTQPGPGATTTSLHRNIIGNTSFWNFFCCKQHNWMNKYS